MGTLLYLIMSVKEREEKEQAQTTSKVVRRVSIPQSFLFFTDPEQYTGRLAQSLPELYDELAKVPIESVEFHFQRDDFDHWIKRVFGDEELAAKIRKIDKSLRGEKLRAALREAMHARVKELDESTGTDA